METRDEFFQEKELDGSEPREAGKELSSYDLTPLFTLLMRQPPKDHDFHTCPMCQRYGITEI